PAPNAKPFSAVQQHAATASPWLPEGEWRVDAHRPHTAGGRSAAGRDRDSQIGMYVDQPGLGHGRRRTGVEHLVSEPAVNSVHAMPGVDREVRPALGKQGADKGVLGGTGANP